MYKFKDILNELEIQPNIPDPIKRKGLKIGDEVQFVYNTNDIRKTKINDIAYFKHINNSPIVDIVYNWNDADHVSIRCEKIAFSFSYFKFPKDKAQIRRNKQFDTIKKINSIQELEIQPNYNREAIVRKLNGFIDEAKNYGKYY